MDHSKSKSTQPCCITTSVTIYGTEIIFKQTTLTEIPPPSLNSQLVGLLVECGALVLQRGVPGRVDGDEQLEVLPRVGVAAAATRQDAVRVVHPVELDPVHHVL